MAAVQNYQVPSMSTNGSSHGSNMVDGASSDQLPVGLRVLVVDDSPICLKVLESLLKECMYHVTTCCEATVALNLLRERKGCFDLVISEVDMPDMDGLKFIQHVTLEMDLPVIMMSAAMGYNNVMQGIAHGACNFLTKPVRFTELKNKCQHAVQKQNGGSKEPEQSGSVEESDRYEQGTDGKDYACEGMDCNWEVITKEEENDSAFKHGLFFCI